MTMANITRRDAVKISAGAAIIGGAVSPRTANAADLAGQTGEPTASIQHFGITEPDGGKPFTSVARSSASRRFATISSICAASAPIPPISATSRIRQSRSSTGSTGS
jgi:hypothetical protein